MQVITIGKRFVPAEQIAFVEVFDPASNPEFKPNRDYKGRVVLINRDIVLTEMTPQDFAEAHNMRLLAEDNVAVGQAIAFRVETFSPTETFQPVKAYMTRLKWRDQDENEQSSFCSPRLKQFWQYFRRVGQKYQLLPKGHHGGRSAGGGHRRSMLYASSYALRRKPYTTRSATKLAHDANHVARSACGYSIRPMFASAATQAPNH